MMGGVEVDGLKEFRAALRASVSASPRQLSTAIRNAGRPVIARASDLAPVRTGLLSRGYTVRVRGTAGDVVSRVLYGPGAEWGSRGKWKGFVKHGPPGQRFAGQALEDRADEVVQVIELEMASIVEINGWAVP
ncbi:MAG: hypothetical protein ACRDH8_12990 [Actinomycetota bacterium]